HSVSILGLLVTGAENVGVAVVHFERERIDRHTVYAATFKTPPLLFRRPRAVLAGVLRGLLVRNDGVLHRLVPALPHRAFGAVVLEQRQRGVVPVVEVD